MLKQKGKQPTPAEALSREEKEDLKVFLEIIKEVENDPEVRRKMEEDQMKYGTITAEDLMKQFTI